MSKLPVSYEIARNADLGPMMASMYSYVVASNGLYLRAQRSGIEALIPIGPAQVRGLAELHTSVQLTLPSIPGEMLLEMLERSRASTDSQGRLIEILFHLYYAEESWHLVEPPQQRSSGGVTLLPDMAETYPAGAVLVEVHSHHHMQAYFSATDDRDEQGFRLYAVLGTIQRRPTVRVRVGVYGYFAEVPAETLFEMPVSIIDVRRMPAGFDEQDDGQEAPLVVPTQSVVTDLLARWATSKWAQRLTSLFTTRLGRDE